MLTSRAIHVSVLAVIATLSAQATIAAEVHIVNPSSGPDLYVSWNQGPDPVLNDDFTVSFSVPANPDIQLKTGDVVWNVRSQNDDNSPGNIGTISLNPISQTADFDLTIKNGSDEYGHALPGAANVASISLMAGSWNGHSNLGDGRITGNLTNSLTLVKDPAGMGGQVTARFTIDGDLTGDTTIPELVQEAVLTIEQDVSGDIEVGIIRTAAFLNINGDLTGDVTITDRLESGQLHVFGDVGTASCVTIQNIVGGESQHSHARFNFDNEPGRTFAGDLVFVNGIPTDQHVEVYGAITSTGSVSLNGHDMDGQLFFHEGGSGTIFNIVDVAGKLTLTIEEDKAFSGTLTLASQSGGEIELLDGGNLAGTITVTGNMSASEEGDGMVVDGDITSTGRIEVNGGLSGNLFVNESCSGTIDVGQTLTGSISIAGALQGDIETGSHLTGSIDVAGEMTYTASLTVAGSLNGDLSFGQSVDGTIHALTELGSSGSISIVKKLKARGRILVDDLCYGAISVGEDTVDLSLIHVIDGIASTGSITINDSAGNFNADGDIRVGTTNVTPPLDPVTFDGSILIKDNAFGSGGDLGGTIRVVGCHATDDPLDICLCGGDGGSNISIIQTGCGATQAEGWECVSGCP